jgi:hypothetical protein
MARLTKHANRGWQCRRGRWADGSQAARGWAWDVTSQPWAAYYEGAYFEAASGAPATVRIDRGNLSL